MSLVAGSDGIILGGAGGGGPGVSDHGALTGLGDDDHPQYLTAVDFNSSIEVVMDGHGDVLTTGLKGYVHVPFDCELVGVAMLADVSGSISVDIWKDTYANYPPVNADSITGGNEAEITSAIKSQPSIAGWTTAFAEGDVLAFNVDSVTTITRVTLSLTVERSA